MQYRSFITSSNLLVVSGKNASQNDSIVKKARKGDLILHTEARGSPFCIICARKRKIDVQSMEEAAIFCASFSKAWKQGKKSVEVHVFKPEDTYKRRGMPTGTYGVRKVLKKIKAKPALAIGFKGRWIQCSPISALDRIYVKLDQGKMEKEKAAERIIKLLSKRNRNIKPTKEEVMQLIPAGGFRIR